MKRTVVVGLVALSAAISTAPVRSGPPSPNEVAKSTSPSTANTPIGKPQATAEQIAAQILPCMATIRANTSSGLVSGSGFIVRSDGVLVTNVHVIRDASTVSIKISSGETFDQVRIIGFDKSRDLALLKFAGFGLPQVEMGDSDVVKVGAKVLAVGSPSGLENTVTEGIVSGTRSLESGIKVIQTDAAASPGNSGGPLVDALGQVIGVITFGISEKSLNFAIPINYVRGLMGLDTQLSLADFNTQVGQQTSLFSSSTATDSPSGKWRSLETNTVRLLRQDGDHLTGESFTRDESTPLASYDLTKQSDGTFTGRAIGTWTCQYWASWAFPSGEWRPNSCKTENQIVLTRIEPNRIEGRLLGPGHVSGPDRTSAWRNYCRSCGESIEKTWQNFVWVRLD
jgi:V8-like Glu-specific endopeptidase